MSVITMKQLLEAGVHFGHHTRRWNPKMKEYIFGARNGVYIIDLQKTADKIEECYAAMVDIVRNNNKVLFVGTRKQIQDIIREEAVRCEQYYIDKRWLGGTLTNFKTLRRSIAKLHRYEQMAEDGTFEMLPKKEVIAIKKEQERLEAFFGGIKTMQDLPGAIFVVDPKTEHNAVAEARKLGIPVFGLVDTNCDPDDVDYIIPGNDDGVRAVRLILGIMANSVIEGNGGAVEPYVLPEEEESHEYVRNDHNNNDRRWGRNQRDRRESSPRQHRTPYRPADDNRKTNNVVATPVNVGTATKEVAEVLENKPVAEVLEVKPVVETEIKTVVETPEIVEEK